MANPSSPSGRIAFLPHWVSAPVDDESVLLLSERRRTLLRGRLMARLAPLLDGSRTKEEIVAELAGVAAPVAVERAIASLAAKGYVGPYLDGVPMREAAFWSIQDIDPAEAHQRLRATAVAVECIGEVDATALRTALAPMGIGVADDAPLTLAITDDYLRPELASLNRRQLASGRPWLLAKPVGMELWIGPLIRPYETACWECLEPRLRGNREVEMFAAGARGHGEPPALSRAASAASIGVAAHLIALEAARWIAAGALPALESALVSFDLATLQSASHAVVRRPQCAACGAADRASFSRAGLPIDLSNETIASTDGGFRITTPEQTVERYRHLISPITGWVSRLERAPAPNAGVAHVYFAGHNFARQPARSIDALKASLRSHSSGKGTTAPQAQASALGEALERASGVFVGDEPRHRARFAELRDTAIHPHDLLLYSERQYRERSEDSEVPAPFDETRAIEWTPAWSLTRGEVRHLPAAFCYYAYPQDEEHAFCRANSNGSAAGNTTAEAILQGFFEVVERDAVALWWYSRAKRPRVELASFDEPYFARETAMLRSLHREMWLLDLTADLDLPVYGAVSRRLDGAEEILLGFGAHADAKTAALRAVTELNQMLAWTRRPQAVGALLDSATMRWLRSATIADHPYLAPSNAASRAPEEKPATDLREEVLRCVAAAERRGLEVIVLDQTRPEIGLPVVKVVMPGMRHFQRRLAPGRLYDVPARLGSLDRKREESELNPIELIL